MKDLKHEGKDIKSELKAGSQDNQNRGNMPKPPYNPQKPLENTPKQKPTGQNIGGGAQQGGLNRGNLGTGQGGKVGGFDKNQSNKDKGGQGGTW